MNDLPAKHRFFAPPDDCVDGMVVLSEDESRHATRVLRLGTGDTIVVVDGEGMTHMVSLLDVAGKRVRGTILSSEMGAGEPRRSLHIGLAVLHQAARWETFLEKAVELGCTRITPLITQRTQHSRMKDRRLQNIMISALKQSERSRLPLLDEPTPLEHILEEKAGLRAICHEAVQDGERLAAWMQQRDPDGTENCIVLIGPEGGFADAEVARAAAAGWTPVWMGNRRLRAETAAMVAAAVLSQWEVR